MKHLLPLHHSYASLPDRFFTRTNPTPVRAPKLLKLNHRLAGQLGLNANALESEEGAAIFAGNAVPEGAQPVAMAYAGHQFGHFVPSLGDGRAILLGEVKDPAGKLWDIHLKGSGQTPFSRRGDGRAALGPVIREYIISEAMVALGIPTTQSLAMVATGELVFREKPMPGAVLTRVASSHIRIGTFEYFAARGDVEALKLLTEYALARHYPGTTGEPAIALLGAVAEAQAKLVASWLHVGFIHGVMNTDNMSISGETIDYGPCAFMDGYNPATVFSSIDRDGRYAYGAQPHIAQWNIAKLAEALLVMFGEGNEPIKEQMQEIINAFHGKFVEQWLLGMRSKLGLMKPQEDDLNLITGLLECMQGAGDDYTNTLRRLTTVLQGKALPEEYKTWQQHWQQRLCAEGDNVANVTTRMNAVNPAFIPRNHKVEEAIAAAAVTDSDLQPMEKLLTVLAKPFDDWSEYASYAEPAPDSDKEYKTFCGT